MYLWVFLCGVLLICFYLATLSLTWRARRSYARLPTYPHYPIVGNIYKIAGDSRKLFRTFNEMTNIIEKTNQPFAFWAGPVPVILINDSDDIRVAANAFADKPYYYSFARVWLGDGLVTAPGWLWKKNVKKIASTFIGPVIDNYQVVFNEQANKLVRNLSREVDREFFDSMPYFSVSTMEAICQSSLGVAQISDSLVTDEYYKAFSRTLELLVHRALNLFLHPNLIYRVTPAYKELLECVSVLHSVSGTVMKERKIDRKLKNRLATREELDETKDENTTPSFKAFLDMLLDMSEKDPSLTEKQILAEINTIILAGQETVATTLFYTLLVVGSRKDVQDNVYEEIKRVCDKRDVQKGDLSQLIYCEAVINESLRIYPPAVAVLRYADHDLKLKSCTITKGTTTVLNIWGAGRSQRSWGRDAADFKPERWLPPNVPCTNAHLPFSTGKRACIGKKYAMAFLKTILVHVLREYEIISEDSFNQMEFKIDVALRPINGHLMKLRLRG